MASTRMGAPALLVGCLGDDDFRRKALSELRSEDILTDGVQMARNAPTGIALIMVDDHGQNTILVAIRANADLSPEAVDLAITSHTIELGTVIVNLEVQEECVAAVVRVGRGHGVPTAVDAGPSRHHHPETWRDADVMSPNAPKSATLVGYPVQDDASALRAARDLLRQGPGAVVLILGERSALLFNDTEETFVPSFQVDAFDTTGAGDALTATPTLAP